MSYDLPLAVELASGSYQVRISTRAGTTSRPLHGEVIPAYRVRPGAGHMARPWCFQARRNLDRQGQV
jgi:hypothetical protein